jgi:acyl-CoA thioesterase-2
MDGNTYQGDCQDLGFPNVFGGQVLGQALVASWKEMGDMLPHSLHAYFLRPGSVSEPIYYEVEHVRKGKSFSTNRVVAKQFGRPIFTMMASFQVEEQGLDHSVDKPDVLGPEGIPSELDLARAVKEKIPEKVREKFTCERPIEIRNINPVDYFNPIREEPVKDSWIKSIDGLDDDMKTHFALLAYASDFGLSTTALLPHAKTFMSPGMQVASIDHAMWFHRKFRMDEWLLYRKDSPTAQGSRGFNRGQIFDRNGALIASVAQESLIRNRSNG